MAAIIDLRERLGPIGIWGGLPPLPAAGIRPWVARAAELGYGSLWVGEGAAREPFPLLAAVSEASGGMVLGTSIVNIYGRDPMASKMAAMTLHELTGGRFALGLGVSHEHLVQKLRGHAYEKPLTRMREYLAAYAELPYRGPTLDDADGTVTQPPVLIAALRARMLRLAATETDGTLPYLTTAARTAWMRSVLDQARPADCPPALLIPAVAVVLDADPASARERARQYVVPYCRAVNYQHSLREQGFEAADWEPPYSDRLVDQVVAWGTAEQIHGRLEEHRSAGADSVAVIPLPTERLSSLEVLEALAPNP
jgi:probable F420-dependent oxidoreductase